MHIRVSHIRKILKFVTALVIISQTVEYQSLAQQIHLPFGNMDTWMVRRIDESGIIGGATKYAYEVAPCDTLKGNVPYRPDFSVSPWGTSSILAVVSGITKSSTTVFPEKRGSGYAARMETRIERVKVLGMINISALATGTMYLGEIKEPVRDVKNPMAKLLMGIPFTACPSAIRFDYKFRQGENDGQRIRVPGFGRTETLPGKNCGEMCLVLQRRWEDEEGNICAERVATAWIRISQSTDGWINGHVESLHYGDISDTEYFKPFMSLSEGTRDDNHCLNSKGKSVPIKEVGWALPGTEPTHIILRFSSGYGGAYVGSPGAALYIDNVSLVYN